jgi:hypothetical protein
MGKERGTIMRPFGNMRHKYPHCSLSFLSLFLFSLTVDVYKFTSCM